MMVASGGSSEVETLVGRAQRGDRDAIGQLYDRYRDRVARLASGRLGDAGKAEDVTSETFEGMLRSLLSYRLGTDFEAWLFAIAHRKVSDHYRRLGRRREVTFQTGDAPVVVVGPEEEAMAAADRLEITRAFRSLRADQQEVLALRVLAGLSADQAGSVLGKSPGAIRVAQHRALTALRDAMG